MTNRGRGWTLVRVAWWLTVLAAIALVLASLPGYPAKFQEVGSAGQTPLVSAFAGIAALTSLLTALLSLALAGLIYRRRSQDLMALFVSFYLVAYGSTMSGPLEVVEGSLGLGPVFSAYAQMVLLMTPTLALFCLFPNGRFVPRWTRWIIPASLLLLPSVVVSSPDEIYAFRTPALQLMGVGLGILIFAGLAAQVNRYRKVSNAVERQQTRIVVFGFFLWLALLILDGAVFIGNPKALLHPGGPWFRPLTSAVWFLSLGVLPFSLALAVLRYRLFDVDVIIRRTLTYSLLSALLVLIYLGSVTLIQAMLGAVSGQRSEIAIIASTLLIAALFVPLRGRLQSGIDRRFYRRKYDAARVLQSFASAARDEVELTRLTDSLMGVVDETMQPESVSVWLRTSQSRGGTV